jgi:hypothetical protein
MNARTVYNEVLAAGGRLWIESGKLKVGAPAPLPDALVGEIRAAKLDLLKLLAEPAEARRRRVRDMLARNPKLRLAVVTTEEANAVIVTIGRRAVNGRGFTADLTIDRAKYDGVVLLKLVEKYAGRAWPETEGNA